MIRDRGRIKWTSMMLPEHVKMLRDWAKEDSFKEKVELDEQQLEEMNEIAAQAMEDRKKVVITYYRLKQYELLIGYIHYYDALQKRLHVVDTFDDPQYVSMENIVDIRFHD
ncbi:YolD-like family protein [Falsibacillus albus]|uniref:YolD-like family protein n=1 Tax=Falsibacillus albus TaxID=2478915 RepID=A0A3L7JJN5_9BACI|nr:YolD-like family protein [Falsibacillus albus]RLQ90654.1 YolD-like family protein [Falsibacillus albus]